jgi:hypothetical protein
VYEHGIVGRRLRVFDQAADEVHRLRPRAPVAQDPERRVRDEDDRDAGSETDEDRRPCP